MEKKKFLVFDPCNKRYGIATITKEEWKPEEEYGPSGGNAVWYSVDFYDGTDPIINRGENMFFLAKLKGRFKNPAEALMAHLPEVISFMLRCIKNLEPHRPC